MKNNKEVNKTQGEKVGEKKNNHNIKIFILKYFLLIAAFIGIKNFKPISNASNFYEKYNEFIAYFTSNFLSLINIPARFQDSLIFLPSITLRVGFECSGIEAVLMFSVAVLAYPGKWKSRFIGIAAGFFALQLLNLFRILGLAYSAVYLRPFFEIIHIYIAQSFMILAALLFFIVYLNFLDGSKKIAD